MQLVKCGSKSYKDDYYMFDFKDSVVVCKCRVGQSRVYAPFMTVYLVVSLPKIS